MNKQIKKTTKTATKTSKPTMWVLMYDAHGAHAPRPREMDLELLALPDEQNRVEHVVGDTHTTASPISPPLHIVYGRTALVNEENPSCVLLGASRNGKQDGVVFFGPCLVAAMEDGEMRSMTPKEMAKAKKLVAPAILASAIPKTAKKAGKKKK